MTNEKYFERKVMGLERYFYKRPNPNTVMVGQFNGAVTQEQLREAIISVRKKHPMLNVRVSQKENGDAYFTTESAEQPTVEIIDGDFQADQLIERAKMELMFRHPIDTGPLVRFVIFRAENEFSILVNSHHMISDGLSMYYLLRDIFLLIGRSEAENGAEPVIAWEEMPDEAYLKNHHQRLIDRLNNSWAKKNIAFDDTDHKQLHRKFWIMEKGLDMIRWSLTESETGALIRRCREEKITVHSALAAAFLIAQIEVQGKSRYLRNISMPVSIRNRLTKPAGEAYGLYFSSFKLEFKAPKGNDFWTKARAVHNHIQKNITDYNNSETNREEGQS